MIGVLICEDALGAARGVVAERLRRYRAVVEPPREFHADIIAGIVRDRRVDVREEHSDERAATGDVRALRDEEFVVAVRLCRRDGVRL